MRTLTRTDTNVLKGIALLLLLCHHCFYPGEPYDDIVLFGHPVVQNIGEFSKLCVAIFVFLSGYGLTAKTMKDGGIGNLWSFYRHRYMKLMLNYWVVYLIFVPIGFIFFHRTFPIVYGDNWMFKAFVDFLGLHQAIIGHPFGYNATWWFFSCIIFLYALFPLLWKYRSWWMIMIPFSIMLPTVLFWHNGLNVCALYALAFICGLVYALHCEKEYVRYIGGGGKFCLLILLIIGCVYRFYTISAIKWDSAIVIILVVLYSSISLPRIISSLFAFLGKHSYNIFMFHSFIFFYYFHDLIYWSRNPGIICLTLLLVCVVLSWNIEFLKEKLRFDKVVKQMAGIE